MTSYVKASRTPEWGAQGGPRKREAARGVAKAGGRASLRSAFGSIHSSAQLRLAKPIHVYIRTLRAAVRTGRLDAHFSVKSVFGRPLRFATRAAAKPFMATHYRRFGGQKACPAPLPTVPPDYDQRLRALRGRLRLTQDALARRIGAAGKAVVYQWESRKRTPSPVLWQQVLRMEHGAGRTALTSDTHRLPESPVGHDADIRVTSTRKEHGPLPVVVVAR